MKKKTCHCRKPRGGKLSDSLGMFGMPLKMIGLGVARPRALRPSGNALRPSGGRYTDMRYRGNGAWGDMLAQTIGMFGNKGVNELERLARKL